MSEENTLNQQTPRLFVSGGRDYSVDILRCVSCLMVVLVHATRMTMPYYHYDIVEAGTTTWKVMAGYMALFASPTVLFVMVSGIFFLTPQRNVTPKKVWKKNIPKMAACYVFWSLIYGLYRVYMLNGTLEGMTADLFIEQSIIQPPHMWYIPMIISLYILVPFFRCITKNADKGVYKYGLALLLSAMLVNTVVKTPHLPNEETVDLIMSYTPLESILQYSFWMVLGYVLYTYRPKPRTRVILYIAGLAALVVSTICSIVIFEKTGAPNCNWINGKFTIPTFFKNVALFLLITNGLSGRNFSKAAKYIIKKISAATLIIYLVHWLFLRIMFNNQWLWDSVPSPLARIWIYAFVAYAGGTVIAVIFQIVPWNRLIYRKEYKAKMEAKAAKEAAAKAEAEEADKAAGK